MTTVNVIKIYFAKVIPASALNLLLVAICFARSNADAADSAKCGIQKSHFGNMTNGSEIDLFTLTNSHGVICKITDLGGDITEVDVPDRSGKSADVVLGFAHWQEYLQNGPHFGAICGRVANRIANAQFTLDGQTYTLAANNGRNHIHGGRRGFDRVLWHAEIINHADSVSLRLTYTSPDGEEGYPGNLQTVATYTLNDNNELSLEYQATTDKPTIVNLSNHTYWNLAGGGEITNEILTLNADRYTPFDATLIPTGEIVSVKNTPLDFTAPMTIGSRISGLKGNPPIYDNNFVLNSGGKKLALAARLFDPGTGRQLEVLTDQPGLQVYTGNFSNGGMPGKHAQIYLGYASVCLETQAFPDSINHPEFPSIILRPGETYHKTTIWRFSTR